jgi:hypothetical protein
MPHSAIGRDRQVDAAHQDHQHLPERQQDENRRVIEQPARLRGAKPGNLM